MVVCHLVSHEPEGALLLSAKNDSNKDTQKCDENYGPF
jgi:hypothetical protein